jgi:hypothetical protein
MNHGYEVSTNQNFWDYRFIGITFSKFQGFKIAKLQRLAAPELKF